MVSVFIYSVFAIGLIASTAYIGFVVWRTFDVAAQAQHNAARMSEIGVVLRANIWIDPQGVPRAPLGDSTPGDRQRLPSWIVGDDHTSWGARYGWCPMSISKGSGTATANVSSGPGLSYAVDVATVRQPGVPGEPYVVGADPNPSLGGASVPDAIGIVVSPVPYASALPDCASVVWKNGFVTIAPGLGVVPGSAALVEARGSILSSATQGLTSSKFDSAIHVAPQAGGDASGSDDADAMAYGDAYRLWLSVQPRVITFHFAPGSYAAQSGEGEFRNATAARVVNFVASGQGPTTITGATRFAFGGSFSDVGVSFGEGVPLLVDRGADVQVSGAGVYDLQVDGGAVDVDPNSSVGSVEMRGGTLRFVPVGGRLAPASVGGGVVAGTPSGVTAISVGSLTAVAGRLVVDGVDLSFSGSVAGVPVLAPGAQVEILDGGSVAGSTSTDSTPSASCAPIDGSGRTSCALSCDPVHPFVKQSACQGEGGLLLSQGRMRDPATGVESNVCVWRPDQPVQQKNVLAPGASGTAVDAQVTTAVDLVSSASFQPSAGGYCSMNP